jgi:hypothetical protein
MRLYDESTTIDLLICFQCNQVEIFVDGRNAPGFLIGSSPQPVFDKVLNDAGVPLPKPPAQ